MKKYLLVIATISIVPSIAFASWWNPFTWNIFSSHQTISQVQIVGTTTPSNQIVIDNSTTTATTAISIATTTEVTVTATSTPKIDIPVKKVTPPVVVKTQQPTQPKVTPIKTPTPPVQVQTPAVSNSSGGESTICPVGYNCSPIIQTTASATPQSIPVTASPTPLTDQQVCVNSYGQNSVYTGNRNGNGGPVCGCANGYGWNNSQTSCQIQQQTVQQPPTQIYQPPATYQPPQTVSTPPAPQGPTPEQQAACQQAYDLGAASLQLGYQSQSAQLEAKLQQDIANLENQAAFDGNSMYWVSQIRNLTTTKDIALSSLTAQYGLAVSNEKMALQKCLSN